MATLTKKLKGKTPGYEIRFCKADGQRSTIYLGAKRYGEKTADGLRDVVTTLEFYRDNPDQTPKKSVLEKIAEYPAEIQDKLANAGLIVQPQRKTTGELWTAFREAKRDIKETTLEGYDHAERRFFLFFDAAELLSELTTGRMEQWKEYLRTQAPCDGSKVPGLAESTTAGTLTKAKAVFNWAVRVGWLEESPLTGIGRGSFVNKENDRFVTMDEYYRLLDACPCPEWRAIICLARIGGLRAPSEVLRLRWADVNWERSRFYVTSPKTKRYAGKEGRVVPLWDALAVELRRLFESDSSEGTEYVINRYRNPERSNLGTQFARIVKMAGVQPIPRPFDNMRASRSTEVYAEYGAFLESQWIGHSTKVAMKHYLQVREEDFERAVGGKQSPTADSAGHPVRCEKSVSTGFHTSGKKFTPQFTPARDGIGSQGVESVQRASVR